LFPAFEEFATSFILPLEFLHQPALALLFLVVFFWHSASTFLM
jgi:hypothetical protein